MVRTAATNRRTVASMPYALNFNGSKRIVLDSMGNLGSSLTGALSFAVWVRTSSVLTTPQYYLGGSNAVGGMFLLAGITRAGTRVGKWMVQMRDDAGSHQLSVEALARPINTGQYVRLLFTKDASNTVAGVSMYINGVATAVTGVLDTFAAAGCIDFTRQMAIGSSLGTGAVANGWVGDIALFEIWKRALTPAEALADFLTRTPPSGEFAGYNFTEGAGTTIADTQGNHNGTLTNADQWITDTPYKARQARQF